MRKKLIILAHVVVIFYGLAFVGFGDAVSYFLYRSPIDIAPWLAVLNVLFFIFALLQERLFKGCILTKLQAREEKRLGQEETEAFLPSGFSVWILYSLIWIAIARSAIPLIFDFII